DVTITISSTSHVLHQTTHSFPTRRSSDLGRRGIPRQETRLQQGPRIVRRQAHQKAVEHRLVIREQQRVPLRADVLAARHPSPVRSEEHTSELQSRFDLVCRLLLEKKKKKT